MAIEVTLPRMGESIHQGTVTRWLKKPGDPVRRDEPLYEISTDKVDTEVPSPGSGRLAEIRVREGEQADVGSVVAILEEGEAEAKRAAPQPRPEEAVPPPPPEAEPPPAYAGLVAEPVAPPPAAEDVEVVPMSPMRARLARHMAESKRTAPHVTTVYEADLSDVVRIREARRDEFRKRNGIALSYLPFFGIAAVEALREFPVLNASVEGERILYKRRIHLGIAVSVEEGIVVPVVRDAEEKSFLGLARAAQEAVDRGRARRLRPEDAEGPTFTLTNYGVFGGLFATPIVPQPQVAILGLGAVHERPVALRGAVALRWMCYLALSYDHRAIDGATAERFLGRMKERLEGWTEPPP